MDEIDFEQGQQELELYEFGRKMRPIVQSHAWSDLIAYIKEYVEKIDRLYRSLSLADPQVPYVHAGLRFLDEFAGKFQEDLEAAVKAADSPSENLTNFIYRVREASDPMRGRE